MNAIYTTEFVNNMAIKVYVMYSKQEAMKT